jgi:hypothetical protein
MRVSLFLAALVLAAPAIASAQTATAPAASPTSTTPAASVPATSGRPYSTSTTDLGTILDDPDAKAIVDKYVPGFSKNDQVDMARAMTLKDVQQYAPDQLSDKVLAEIDSDFAKLPPKR